tara:strand:+ start:108 stop:992 length:885 start_codon:yes stop_codon:yes gene_type:complete
MSGIDFVPQYYLDIGLDHGSPSQNNLPDDVWLYNYVFKDQEWRRNGKIPNPNMVGGNVAQDGVNRWLFDKYTSEEAQADAVKNYSTNKILYKDKQLELFEKNLEVMSLCVGNGIKALQEIGLDNYNPDDCTTELYCEYQFPGIGITTIGRTDLMTKNFTVELKTKWHTKVLNKGYIPDEPDQNYLKQVAFYWKATGLEPILIYHTGMPAKDRKTKKIKNEYKIFNKTNCELMTPEYFEECLEQHRQVQHRRQNLLMISRDPKVLAKYIASDFSSFYWKDLSQEDLEEARNLWKM